MGKNQKIIILSLLAITIASVGLSKFYLQVVGELLPETKESTEGLVKNSLIKESETTTKETIKKVSETTESVTTETINKEKRRAVALTFDDGPHGEYTPQILDILEEQQVSATFFLLGQNVPKHPNIVKDIQKRNHEIGSHTHIHQELTKASRKELEKDIKESDEAIEKVTGEKPKYV
ncbi:MAG: polysaccharide deacetylase family protein, partial [Vagococcus sp.]|nr:polysaccharide deacetylase family protein [Vagococcus sp.]